MLGGGETDHDGRRERRGGNTRVGGHATIQRQCVCCRLAGGRGEVFTRVWDGPGPTKRSRLQPERIGARGLNDPSNPLLPPPSTMYRPPTCVEIYGNSLFASFKGFRIILLPPFLLPPRVNLLYLLPPFPPRYSLAISRLHSISSFSLSPLFQLVLSLDGLFLLFDTNEYICTSKYERIQV